MEWYNDPIKDMIKIDSINQYVKLSNHQMNIASDQLKLQGLHGESEKITFCPGYQLSFSCIDLVSKAPRLLPGNLSINLTTLFEVLWQFHLVSVVSC